MSKLSLDAISSITETSLEGNANKSKSPVAVLQVDSRELKRNTTLQDSNKTESNKDITISQSTESVDCSSLQNQISEEETSSNDSSSYFLNTKSFDGIGGNDGNYDNDDNEDKTEEIPKDDEVDGTQLALQEPKKKDKTFVPIRESVLKTLIHDKDIDMLNLNKYFRVITNTITILSAQEPWPKDVQLFQHYEVEQILLPDNANCLAVQTFLKMCQLEYKVEARSNADAMSPTGRVPFIKCGAFIVSELEGIVQFVGSKGISLTSELDAESKADMRAYMTLVNNVLGNAELYLCWCDHETYNEVTKPRFGSVHPWPLNHIQTWSKRQDEIKRLKVIGWYQKTLEEVYNDVEACCQALTDRLDGNQYFFGKKPTELEALIFGHLYTILTTPLPNATLANIVKNYPKLIDLITRLEKHYFQRETQHHIDSN